MTEEKNIFSSKERNLPKIREFDGHDWFSTKVSLRNLPHWELKGSTYFVTVRVDEKVGKPFLDPMIARFMVSALCREDNKKFSLQAFVIMPDHLHFICKPLYEYTLSKIMQNLKGSTAYQINKLLNRTGKFWQAESFDHLIRDGISLREKWEYIRENPVKARLVNKAEDYPFSNFYCPSQLSVNAG